MIAPPDRYAMSYRQMVKRPHGIWVRHDQCSAAIAALEAERDRLRDALEGIAAIIRKNVTPAPEPHVLILEDGSRYTGPAVDYLHRLADAIARLCEQEAKLATLRVKP